MKRPTNLVVITMLAGLLAGTPAGAFEVRPDKNLTSGFPVRTKDPGAAYGHAPENNHLIPPCLGGSDDPSNLWPQPKRRTKEVWNAEEKQRLEDKVCKMVWIVIADASDRLLTPEELEYGHQLYEQEVKESERSLAVKPVYQKNIRRAIVLLQPSKSARLNSS